LILPILSNNFKSHFEETQKISMDWDKIFINHISDIGLVSRTYK
jgi:hypothetical protein